MPPFTFFIVNYNFLTLLIVITYKIYVVQIIKQRKVIIHK